MSRAIFFMSACLLSFVYGLATIQFQIFPYQIIREAKNGFEALKLLEDDTHLVTIKRFDASATAKPEVRQLSENAGAERLLVTGGFYQYMEECPRFGCLAWIMKRSGEVLHTWEIDPAVILEGAEGFEGDLTPMNVYPIGLSLAKDGRLTVTFHGRNIFPYTVGIAQFSPTGELLWRRFDRSHHWIDTASDGHIAAPSARYIKMPEFAEDTLIPNRCHTGVIDDEGVRLYSADGKVEKEFWIAESFAKSSWPGLLYAVRNGCDPHHLNSVAIVEPSLADRLNGVDAGDLLVSVREPSVVAILDGDDGTVKRLVAGRTAAQHGPQFLPDGSVVVFDNLGGKRDQGGTRIVRLDLENGTAETVFPRESGKQSGLPFQSDDGGHLSVSPDGKRLMIASKHQSHIFEVEIATGDILWEMDHCMDMSAYLEKFDLEAEASNACFRTYGAYYLEDSPFHMVH